jgi:hypothetical protein
MFIHSTPESIPEKFKNIEMDLNSAYSFKELNETVFLLHCFNHLQEILGDSFEEYHFYIYANIDSNVLPRSLDVRSTKKKVLIFLSNQSHMLNPGLPGDFFAVFKCHLATDIVRERIFHFPLGYVKDIRHQKVKDLAERQIKVFFSGNLNKGRVALYKLLSQSSIPDIVYSYLMKVFKRIPSLIKRDFSDTFPSSYLHFTNGFKKGLCPEKYTDTLYNSQIVLCPKGFLRAETYRHFEAMRAGCVIISERLPNTYLYRNSPIIQVDNWQEGLSVVQKLLDDPILLHYHHHQTLKWWKNVCSELSTAQHVSSRLQTLAQVNRQKQIQSL